MAKLFDRVKFNVSGTPNQGTCTVGSRTTASFYLPSEVGAENNEVFYLLVNASNDEEHGIGTVASGGVSVSRDTVLASIIGGVAGTTKINAGASSIMGFTTPSEAFKSLRNFRIVTAATDTIVDLDAGSTIIYNRATSVAASIAQAGTSGLFKKGWFAYVKNINAGDVTITPTTSTIGDSASATLVLKQGTSAIIVSDGTNYTAYVFHRAIWASTTVLSATEKATARANLGIVMPPQGRLSFSSTTSLTSADQTGITTTYYSFQTGKLIPLWNGTSWVMTEFSQLSNISTNSATGNAGPAAVAADKLYNFFVWDTGSGLALTRSPPWTSDLVEGTGAGTAEVDFTTLFPTNKVAITNGPGAGLGTYVGTARSDSSSQFVDSVVKRWLSNYYNDALRNMQVLEATSTWTNTVNSWHQARGQTSNQIDYVQSSSGKLLTARVVVTMSGSATRGSYAITAIGINSVSVVSGISGADLMVTPGDLYTAQAFYSGPQVRGRSYAAWLEYTVGGTNTYNGVASLLQSGIMGEIFN